jgi:RNA polymerase sigma-70 factor, ECF subfamily
MAQRIGGLREALLALPDDQAELLQLAYFGGRSHTEIARMRNLPLGTVKSRMRMALARLRTTMGDDFL